MDKRILVLAGIAFSLAPVVQAQEGADLFALGHGRALYLTHCAGCHGAHGIDAEGKPVKSNRMPSIDGVPVPDLALIVVRDGSFKPIHVANHISGRAYAEDPARVMPRWDRHLVREWPPGPSAVALKVYWMTAYLESVQKTDEDAVR